MAKTPPSINISVQCVVKFMEIIKNAFKSLWNNTQLVI